MWKETFPEGPNNPEILGDLIKISICRKAEINFDYEHRANQEHVRSTNVLFCVRSQ